MLLVSACSFGSPPRASSAPGKAAIVRWLRGVDSSGVDFDLAGRVRAHGHEKHGEIDMTAGTAHLVIYDGVLYGAPARSSKWLEMGAAEANFLWPAARLSLVWESIELSTDATPPFRLARNQVALLAGGIQATRGEISVPAALHEVGVTLDGTSSVFEVGAPDPTDIVPPAAATPGNVLTLLNPGIAA